jgi:hypothetical protein
LADVQLWRICDLSAAFLLKAADAMHVKVKPSCLGRGVKGGVVPVCIAFEQGNQPRNKIAIQSMIRVVHRCFVVSILYSFYIK